MSHCLTIPKTPPPQTLSLPGGISLEHINLQDVVQPALTPLMPVFNILDTVLSLFNFAKAIPDAMVPPDPTKLTEALRDVAAKADKLLSLVPQLSVPIMVVDLIDLVLDTLGGARDLLIHLQSRVELLARVEERAQELNDDGLFLVADCARQNISQETANLGTALGAMGTLIGLINVFLGMIGIEGIPDLSGISDKPLGDVIEPLDELVKTLRRLEISFRCHREGKMSSDLIAITTPFRRDRKSDFASGTGSALLSSKISQILGTEGASGHLGGELPWRTDFGAGLHRLRHMANDDVLEELARVYIRDALRKWMGDVSVTGVDVARDGESLIIRVSVQAASGSFNTTVQVTL